MTWMLDTNLCAAVLQRSSPKLVERVAAFPVDRVYLSELTVGVLEYGGDRARRPEEAARGLADFLASYTILPYDDAARRAGDRVGSTLHLSGASADDVEVRVAGHALSRKLTLVTQDPARYARIRGLLVVGCP